MKITKSQREEIRQKYGGRCAYCGCELEQRFHVDHKWPVQRNYEYVRDENGRIEIAFNGKAKMRFTGLANEQWDTIENMMPACPSCNTIKGSNSLERFREIIAGFITSLNRDSTQYKFAKRYGLIRETGIEVKFYYETYESK